MFVVTNAEDNQPVKHASIIIFRTTKKSIKLAYTDDKGVATFNKIHGGEKIKIQSKNKGFITFAENYTIPLNGTEDNGKTVRKGITLSKSLVI